MQDAPIRSQTLSSRPLRRGAAVAALATLLLVLPATAAPARAGHSGWSIGAGFHIGGVHFSLAFGGHGHHRPGYYYRTDHPLRYRGHRCSDRCFRARGHVYHHPGCSLVTAHFHHYRVPPVAIFDRYAPPPVWRGHHYRDVRPPYRYHGYYDHDRYDRWHDRRDRYHDRRERYSERRHDRRDRHYDRHDRRHWKDRRHDGHRGRGRGHHEHHRRDWRGGPDR